ncbi:hypothetical protein KSP39_PZI013782 [Platanthera zijinensis]|uniref:Reverse transcriptase Ty1/copia-type domain-containing protein n=1 Tax=Platanthera zijinensis TaxID=2320716 RepID=A0AAP0G3W6_9ASPA
MKTKFEMSDLGVMSYLLGLQIHQGVDSIFIHQQKYISELLNKFGMQDCKPTSTPMAIGEKLVRNDGAEKVSEEKYRCIVGSLIYLTNNRPDIEHVVSYVSRFVSEPNSIHMMAVKHILCYLHGTCDYGLLYKRNEKVNEELSGYSDSDWAESGDDRKSTSGFVIQLGGNTISWNSRKQKCVALSSTKAEYLAIGEAAKELVWLS